MLLASLSALLLALLIDRWLGEPPVRWHPVVWMGHYLGWAGRLLQRQARPDGADYRSFWLGALAWLGGAHFLVVLDEITYPLIYGWMPLDDVLQTLRQRPAHVHVVLTGRRCPPEIIELADTVTEMTKIKHAFNAGVPAQRGIED